MAMGRFKKNVIRLNMLKLFYFGFQISVGNVKERVKLHEEEVMEDVKRLTSTSSVSIDK
jgi:DNA-binding Lrp family transcriptional regulator